MPLLSWGSLTNRPWSMDRASKIWLVRPFQRKCNALSGLCVQALYMVIIWSYGACSGFWCKKCAISSIDLDQIQLDCINHAHIVSQIVVRPWPDLPDHLLRPCTKLFTVLMFHRHTLQHAGFTSRQLAPFFLDFP